MCFRYKTLTLSILSSKSEIGSLLSFVFLAFLVLLPKNKLVKKKKMLLVLENEAKKKIENKCH